MIDLAISKFGSFETNHLNGIGRNGEMMREKLTRGWRPKPGQIVEPVPDEYVLCAETVERPAIVARQPFGVEPWEPPEGLDVCLDCWTEWMQRYDRDLGMQDQGLKTRDDEQEHEGYDNPDPDSVYRKGDEEIAEATDAMIESLRACDRWAIYKKCKITTQWNFPNLVFADALVVAEKALIEKLKNNLAVRALFR